MAKTIIFLSEMCCLKKQNVVLDALVEGSF